MDASALASAEFWLSWIGVAKLVAAFLVATGVIVEFVGDWASRPFEATVKLATENESLRLKNDTTRLSAEAEAAKSEIATANERAAKYLLEQERLKAQLAWRTLSATEMTTLRDDLAKTPSQVNVQYPSGDTEAQYLAIQIANAFRNAGWTVGMLSATIDGIAWGIFIPDAPMAQIPTIRAAFTAAGIVFSTHAVPPMGMGYGASLPNAPTVFVGSKPIP